MIRQSLLGIAAAAMAISIAIAQPLQDTLSRAEQGDVAAQTALGFMYGTGDGVPQDDAEAVRWLRKAAAQGDADAQTGLGLMYIHGQGVPQDNMFAHMWLNLAAAQGGQVARQTRDFVARNITPDEIAEAQRLAREWKPSSR